MAEVTVIIPNYNRAELLVKAVRSVLGQSLPVLEVLVCDDGSTDDSKQAIDAIGDSRVRWIDGSRGGRPAIPRNRGIRESRGEWLAFLDNDDEWLPDKLEKQLRMAEHLGCQAVCCNAIRFIPGKGAQGNYLDLRNERITLDHLLYVNQVICSSAVIHRSIFTTASGFPEDEKLKALEDYSLWLRVATVTDFAFVPEALVIYRDDAGSSIRNEDVTVRQQRKAVFADFLAWGEQEKIAACHLWKVRNRLLLDRLTNVKNSLRSGASRMKKALSP